MEENSNQALRFEKFEIISCLKKDSFSSVYLANHIYLNKRIVLKILHTANLPDPSVLDRFKREAKILARLDHPNIIRVLDFGPAGNDFYLSFEFFESRDLSKVLKEDNLDIEQKKNILVQLVQGLAAAHQAGIIHRDIKPENLLLNEQWQLKIADFGLALMVDETVLTKKSSLVGTPAYMSPEQIRGEPLTPQSDLFSLGLVAYELFCGLHPCVGHDINSTINTILTVDPRQLSARLEAVDEKIKQVILTCLQPDRNMRFKHSGEILELLEIEKIAIRSTIKIHRKKRIYSYLLVIITALAIVLLMVRVSNKGIKENMPTEAGQHPDTLIGQNISPEDNSLKMRTLSESMSMKTIAGENYKTDALAQGTFIILGTPMTTVMVDSQEYGQMPLAHTISLSAGFHNLVLKHKDFPTYEQKFEIQSGKNLIIQVALDSLFGYFNCRIYPWGELCIDDFAVGQSPFLKPVILTPGEHTLTIRNPEWDEFRDTITIVRKETTNYNINLEQIPARIKREH